MPAPLPDNVETGASSRLLLDQISDKWSIPMLGALCKKPLRSNDIRRSLDGIT